ncbi:hypothetical protein BH09ACT5_BH09ACT5_15280 [soil metagenome]
MSDRDLEPLWRHLLGHRLRGLRLANGEKLAETAARAGVSPQYLSEIERGLKEPSSEMIAAVSGALGLSLLDLTTGLSDDLRSFHGLEPQGGDDYRGTTGVPMLMAA